MANILSYIELVDDQASWASLLTLRQGRDLATRLGATLYAVLPCASPPLYGDNDIIAVLSRQGADKVILMTHGALAEPALFRGHGDALLTAATQFPPALLLLPAGPAASDLAPRVAARLGALFVNQPGLAVDQRHHLLIQQPSHGGRHVREFTTADLEHAVVAVVVPDPQRFSQAEGSEEAEVVVLSPGFKEPATPAKPLAPGEVPEGLPERVILVGEGVETAEAWQSVRELAARLDADLRQTPASAAQGLADDVPRIGSPCPGALPGFVLAVGVRSEADGLADLPPWTYLIALHPDREAPIFQRAQLALVTDVQPALLEMLAEAGPRPPARRASDTAPEPQAGAPEDPAELSTVDTIRVRALSGEDARAKSPADGAPKEPS